MCEKAVVAGVLVLHIKISRSLLETYTHTESLFPPWFNNALLWNACTYMHITIHIIHCVLGGAGRYWEMVQRLKVTHFYTAPTAIRMLIRKGDEWVKKYDRSSLRILGCGGLFVHYYTLRVFCILPLPS